MRTPTLARSAVICGLVYLVAGAAALLVGWALWPAHPLLVAAAADVAATVIVFGFSVALDNSSLYDPYWSVGPIALAGFWLLVPGAAEADLARQALVFGLVALWGLRLTWNWARGWQGLSHEDWRYVDLRNKHGRAYWPVSFLGIHLMPTVLVFLGCVSLYPALAVSSRAIGPLDVLGALVTLAAVAIEAAADAQLHAFRKAKPEQGAVLASGLWAFSRHPNYFGEILFWWGLWLFALAADPGWWPAVVGPLAITLLFVFVSIPMIERRMLARRPAFAERRARVSMLVPWPPRRQGEGAPARH